MRPIRLTFLILTIFSSPAFAKPTARVALKIRIPEARWAPLAQSLEKKLLQILPQKTGLEVSPAPRWLSAVNEAECHQKGSLFCWASAVRKDYQQAQAQPFDTVWTSKKKLGPQDGPDYLLLINVLAAPGDNQGRISAVWLDTHQALALAPQIVAAKSPPNPELESQIFAKAVLHHSQACKIIGLAQIDSFTNSILKKTIPSLRLKEHYQPQALAHISLPEENLSLHIDGEKVQSSTTSKVFTAYLGLGSHQVQVLKEDKLLYQESLRISSTQERSFDLLFDFPEQELTSRSPLQTINLYTGVGLLLGGSLLALSPAILPPPTTQATICDSCTVKSEDGFVRFGDYADGSRTGPMVTPLGYSLAATGGTMALHAWLDPQNESPWLAWALGLALGAASYGISEAVDASL